ncbi:MAG: hypothetical protein PUK70_01670 [Bacteroidales bacterium]|nr:hypothetical protein [Bacteroidales bacterium]MDY6002657.1 hypothetical protein [Candidatus Cryptobacteroides sp.]
MRKLIFITTVIIAITASSFSISAQKIEPEPLTFRKTYQMPGMSQKELYRYTAQWNDRTISLQFDGSSAFKSKWYSVDYNDLAIKNKPGSIFGHVFLNYYEGYFDLIFTGISVYWGNKAEYIISSVDNNLNRTRLWFLMHNEEAIEQGRLESAKLFEMITASMDEYLKTGPEDTFNLSAMQSDN